MHILPCVFFIFNWMTLASEMHFVRFHPEIAFSLLSRGKRKYFLSVIATLISIAPEFFYKVVGILSHVAFLILSVSQSHCQFLWTFLYVSTLESIFKPILTKDSEFNIMLVPTFCLCISIVCSHLNHNVDFKN